MHLRHWRRASFRRASFRRLMAPDTHAVEVQMSIAKTKVGGEGPHVISMDGDRQPSSCAPPVEPSKMFSPFRSASRGSANGDGHYAACKVSGFKSVIDFPSRSGLNLRKKLVCWVLLTKAPEEWRSWTVDVVQRLPISFGMRHEA